MDRRMGVVVMGVVFLAGCATTRQSGSVEYLQSRVNELEKRLESKEEEIRNLQYKVDDLSGRMGRATIASSSQRSSGEVTTTKREGIIRVDTTAEEIQSALQAAGYYNGPIDGKIGGKTKTAIMEFQKANDLTADGIIGKKTWLALRTYLP